MTRREAREHCFKMLFCQDFYPAEEKEEQLERYFESPVEDVTCEDGTEENLHRVDVREEDQAYLKVAINEAVELAKKFGGDDAPAFVNGILAKLV